MATTAADIEWRKASKKGGADEHTLTEYVADAGGSTTILVDAALNEADDYWNGAVLIFEADTATGALQDVRAHVKDFDAGTDTITFWEQLPAAVAAGDTYRINLGGNYRNDTAFRGLAASAPVDVTGVVFEYTGYQNGTGNGTLTYTQATNMMQWTAPSGTIGPQVDVTGDASYDIFDDDDEKYITIAVTNAALPVGDESDTIALTQPERVAVPNAEADENRDGKIRHILFVPSNTNAATTFGSAHAYVGNANSSAAATTTTAIKDQTAGALTVTDISNWPSSGWVHNDTLNDVAYYYNISGTTSMMLKARNTATKLAFDAGGGGTSKEIEIGDTVVDGTTGGQGVVRAIQVNAGTWAGDDAEGYLWLFEYNGTAFGNNNAINVGGVLHATADGADVPGLRDHTAQNWGNGDIISYMPELDIGLDAPNVDQYEDPSREEHAPPDVTFTAPLTYDTGLNCSDIDATEHYGVWARETMVPDTRPESDVDTDVILEGII